MARSDPAHNDQVALARDIAAQSSSGWAVLRGVYSDEVVTVVEAAGCLSLGDLQRIELAEYLSMVELLRSADDPGDRLIERIESLKLQSRKHLTRITEAMGPSVDANTQTVEVPAWLSEPLIRVEAAMRVMRDKLASKLDPADIAMVDAVISAAQTIPGADAGDEMM